MMDGADQLVRFAKEVTMPVPLKVCYVPDMDYVNVAEMPDNGRESWRSDCLAPIPTIEVINLRVVTLRWGMWKDGRRLEVEGRYAWERAGSKLFVTRAPVARLRESDRLDSLRTWEKV